MFVLSVRQIVFALLVVLKSFVIYYYFVSGSALQEMGDGWKNAKSVYDFNYKDIDGVEQSMDIFKGHPLIVVNVASK